MDKGDRDVDAHPTPSKARRVARDGARSRSSSSAGHVAMDRARGSESGEDFRSPQGSERASTRRSREASRSRSPPPQRVSGDRIDGT